MVTLQKKTLIFILFAGVLYSGCNGKREPVMDVNQEPHNVQPVAEQDSGLAEEEPDNGGMSDMEEEDQTEQLILKQSGEPSPKRSGE